MKRLLVLLAGAAVVGFIISKARQGEDVPVASAGGASASAVEQLLTAEEPAPAPLETASTVRPEPADALAAAPAAPETPKETPREPVLLSATVTQAEAAAADAPKHRAVDDAFQSELARAIGFLDENRRIEARTILTRLYLKSKGGQARNLRDVLDRINRDLVFNPGCLEGAVVHTVEPGEVLLRIANTYGVNAGMIARLNRIDPNRVVPRQRLKILAGRTSLFAYKSEFRMALLIDDAYVKEYAIGIGKDDRTPVGEFVVTSMLVEPRWYPPGGGVIEYGEEGHLLGERWIGFRDEPWGTGLGIHGTNDESTIGTKCSNGCIRMRNADVIEIYDFVQMETKVCILD